MCVYIYIYIYIYIMCIYIYRYIQRYPYLHVFAGRNFLAKSLGVSAGLRPSQARRREGAPPQAAG